MNELKGNQAMKLVDLTPSREKDIAYMCEILNAALDEVREGRVKQIAVIWEDQKKGARGYRLSSSDRWSIIGLLETIKVIWCREIDECSNVFKEDC